MVALAPGTAVVFFFSVPATTEIYTLSLHDALPICIDAFDRGGLHRGGDGRRAGAERKASASRDRKSTRLNSSHVAISYAVFCLKKKTVREAEDRVGEHARLLAADRQITGGLRVREG